MQIMIDIDDMAYKFVQNTTFVEDVSTLFKQTKADREKTLFLYDILDAIKSGTPLPKGHGDLIDRDLLQNAMYDLCDEAGTLKDNPWRDNPHIDAITDVISFAPTIIEADKAGEEE